MVSAAPLRCPTTMRWNLCDFCRDRASASRRMCRSLALMIHWQAGKAFPLWPPFIRMRRSGQGLPSAALKPCRTAPPAMPASFCRWSWWNGKAQGGCHVRLYEDPLQNRHSGLPSKGSGTPAHRGDLDTVGGRFMFIFRVQRRA